MPKAALKKLGPCLSSKLADCLVKEHGIAAATARKRIERAIQAGEICALKGVKFVHNQTFLAIPGHVGKKSYYRNLCAALTEAKSALRFPLAAMGARGGCVHESIFPGISGCPIQSQKKQDSQKIKQILLDLGFILRDGAFLKLGTLDVITNYEADARLQAEQALLRSFAGWLQRQRFIGDKMSFRFDEEHQFGAHQWDFVAPSYIAPIATRTKAGAGVGFVVADVVLGRAINKYEVEYFLTKCMNIRVHQANRPFLAFLIADWFDQDALNLAQSSGVIFTTPKNLFGRKFAEALEDFRKTLEKKDCELAEQAVRIEELLAVTEDLTFMKSLNDNLRGRLFEVIVGHCYVKQFGGTVQHGLLFKDLQDPEKKLDCDVLQLTPGVTLRACECKGYRGTNKVTLDDVKKWVCRTAPAIRKHYGTAEYPAQEYAFWTSGDFESDARDWIENFARSCRKYQISYKYGEAFAEVIEKFGDNSIRDIYKRWFRPLSRARGSG